MKRLTKVEEEIMQIIWQLDRCLVSDIIKYMVEEQGAEKPPHSSISSVVRLLEKKGFVDHKAYGRTHEYFPIISKEAYSSSSLSKLVSDYFGGSMSNLVSHLVKEHKVDSDEIKDLLDNLDD